MKTNCTQKTIPLNSEEIKNISGGDEPAYGIGYCIGIMKRWAGIMMMKPHWNFL